MIPVGIIGATGYAGVELVRLLLGHPEVELVALGSVSFEGQQLSQIYPNLQGLISLPLVSTQEVIQKSQVIFASLPHGFSQEIAQTCIEQGKILIDLGADFRLHREEEYKEWYGGTFLDHSLHKKAVYAIPELFRKEIEGATLVANPGCYPTSVALGLAPLLQTVGLQKNSLIIDAKSGVTGAGRTCTQGTHFPECNQSFHAYKVGEHRHTPEIEQTLSQLGGEPVSITFVPHLLPINRGILSTLYLTPKTPVSLPQLHESYTDFYKNEPFVRVLDLGKTADLKYVTYSNYCDVSLHEDKRTGRMIIISVLDNMIKGAAGQAIQNMNLVCGISETTGLTAIPPAF